MTVLAAVLSGAEHPQSAIMSSFAVPGQVLSNLTSHQPGAGTHVADNHILASLAGSILTVAAASKSTKPTISVTSSVQTSVNSPILPIVGSAVLCRVLRVQQRQLQAAVLTIEPSNTSQSSSITSYPSNTDDETQFLAILRREDVRVYEKDKVVMNESFRVGDIIRATVISLGDERNYYVSTAGNEYGVVIARSDHGNAMVPVSWKEMRDVVTGRGESRKVAKPT